MNESIEIDFSALHLSSPHSLQPRFHQDSPDWGMNVDQQMADFDSLPLFPTTGTPKFHSNRPVAPAAAGANEAMSFHLEYRDQQPAPMPMDAPMIASPDVRATPSFRSPEVTQRNRFVYGFASSHFSPPPPNHLLSSSSFRRAHVGSASSSASFASISSKLLLPDPSPSENLDSSSSSNPRLRLLPSIRARDDAEHERTPIGRSSIPPRTAFFADSRGEDLPGTRRSSSSPSLSALNYAGPNRMGRSPPDVLWPSLDDATPNRHLRPPALKMRPHPSGTSSSSGHAQNNSAPSPSQMNMGMIY